MGSQEGAPEPNSFLGHLLLQSLRERDAYNSDGQLPALEGSLLDALCLFGYRGSEIKGLGVSFSANVECLERTPWVDENGMLCSLKGATIWSMSVVAFSLNVSDDVYQHTAVQPSLKSTYFHPL